MNATRPLPVVVLTLAVSALAACESGPAEVPCPAPSVNIIGPAALAFADSVEPPPRKFLFPTSAWGDSALPDVAASALRGEGPSYLFPPDSNVNRPVRDGLIKSGPYSGLLVFYHGIQSHGDTAVDVTFSGRFVTGPQDGMVVPHKSVRMVCNAGRWAMERPDTAGTDTTGADSAEAAQP